MEGEEREQQKENKEDKEGKEEKKREHIIKKKTGGWKQDKVET